MKNVTLGLIGFALLVGILAANDRSKFPGRRQGGGGGDNGGVTFTPMAFDRRDEFPCCRTALDELFNKLLNKVGRV